MCIVIMENKQKNSQAHTVTELGLYIYYVLVQSLERAC